MSGPYSKLDDSKVLAAASGWPDKSKLIELMAEQDVAFLGKLTGGQGVETLALALGSERGHGLGCPTASLRCGSNSTRLPFAAN